MMSDIDAPADPDISITAHIVEKASECGGAAWSTDKAAMQPNRHHLGRGFAFQIERIEAILEIGIELITRVEALASRETHVVDIEL
jgi:hypothetical protein